MIEELLLHFLTISLYGNVALTIIAIVQLVILTIIIIKNNHIPADQ